MKVCIIGGHLSPAIAVIDALGNDHSIVFIGRKYSFEADKTESLEYHTIQERKIPFIELKTGRVQRKLSSQTIPSLLKVPKGFFQALKVLQKETPDVVVGFGGYLSLPVCLAAYMLHIPIIIHEQTLEAGLANKVIGKLADAICISFETSKQFFPQQKCVLTGNPLRPEIIAVKQTKKEKHEIPSIFITGGSTGSHAINTLIAEILPSLLEKCTVTHQTGAANQREDRKMLTHLVDGLDSELRKRYRLQEFMSAKEMADQLYQADVVISRSGMNTTTELLYLEKPCLLIPLPYGQKMEQLQNAKYLKDQGLAEIVDQQSIMKDEFLEKIIMMLTQQRAHTHTQKDLHLIHEKAANHIVRVINDVYQKKKNTA